MSRLEPRPTGLAYPEDHYSREGKDFIDAVEELELSPEIFNLTQGGYLEQTGRTLLETLQDLTFRRIPALDDHEMFPEMNVQVVSHYFDPECVEAEFGVGNALGIEGLRIRNTRFIEARWFTFDRPNGAVELGYQEDDINDVGVRNERRSIAFVPRNLRGAKGNRHRIKVDTIYNGLLFPTTPGSNRSLGTTYLLAPGFRLINHYLGESDSLDNRIIALQLFDEKE